MAPAALLSATTATTAPTVVGPTTKSIIQNARLTENRPFNPTEHLAYKPPAKIHTMAELGLEGAGISPNAISEPFRLFTEEAFKQMRAEIFSEPVLQNCQYASSFCTNMIRGMGHARAPFFYDVWKSSEVLSKVSEIAGIELVFAYDYEIANINIAAKDDPIASESSAAEMPFVARNTDDDGVPAFAWHYDSFPFVCVTMLSDCTGMLGGETAINLPSGEIKKVRGPAMGYAVVMQGRYLHRQALKALGGRERISMVTPFRPKDPLVRDETILVGVRGISNLEELFPQYFEYRLDVLEERVRAQRKEERSREKAHKPFDVEEKRRWLEEQRDFIDSMLREMYVPQ
ncbi:hypothetical protein BDW66DRAFT_159815 [Aspergillus desertorum]